MQFNVTSTEKSGLIQTCERYTGLGLASISGVSAVLVEFTNYLNEESRTTWHHIFTSYGGWQYEDGNQTDLPSSVATLTAGQTSYALPSGSLTVRGIEIKDTGGIYTQLYPVTEEQIRTVSSMGEFYKTAGTPLYYQLIGQTVRIFPASNYSQASSFKVFYDRGSVAFVSTDTTATPGFASEYHDLLALGASLKWLKIRKSDNPHTQQIEKDYLTKQSQLKDFYSKKFSQMFPPRITVRDQIRDYV